MCTRELQNEVAKRRDLQERIRPLMAAVIDLDTGTEDVLEAAYSLVENLGVRRCCITFPGENHGSQGRECNREAGRHRK